MYCINYVSSVLICMCMINKDDRTCRTYYYAILYVLNEIVNALISEYCMQITLYALWGSQLIGNNILIIYLHTYI